MADLLEPGGQILGMLAAVIERGDDKVIGTQGAAVQHVAHPIGGVDPQPSRDV